MRTLVAAALLAAALPAAAGDAVTLPEDGKAGGFARSGEARIFEGPALYDHIDGGAEIFLELGFEAATVARYRRGEDGLVAEVYRMSDPAAALGIYLAKCGRETPAPGFEERHTAGRWQLAFVKGRHYVLVGNDSGSADAAGALVDFAKRIAAGIPSAPPVEELGLLPAEGLVPDSTRIVRGPFGLQAIATLGEGDVLLLARGATAVAADYREPGGGTTTRIVAEYPTAERAAEALAHLRANLDPLRPAIESGPTRLVLGDPSGRFGVAEVEGRRLTIRLDLDSIPAPRATPAGPGR